MLCGRFIPIFPFPFKIQIKAITNICRSNKYTDIFPVMSYSGLIFLQNLKRF